MRKCHKNVFINGIDRMKTDTYNKSTVWFLSTPIRIFALCAACRHPAGLFFCLCLVEKNHVYINFTDFCEKFSERGRILSIIKEVIKSYWKTAPIIDPN